MEKVIPSLFVITWAAMSLYAVYYTTSQIFKHFKDTNNEIRCHRLEHIKILLVLIGFNVALFLTDISRGVDVFIYNLTNTPPMSVQYLFMVMFLYFAGMHLQEEIHFLEDYYKDKKK